MAMLQCPLINVFLRVEWGEGLVVEPEDDVGPLPVPQDPAGQLRPPALQHLQAEHRGCNTTQV